MSSLTDDRGMERSAGRASSGTPIERTVNASRLATWADRALYGALLLVITFSPFEAGYPPLGRFLWATFTNLEVLLLLLCAALFFKLAVDSLSRKRLTQLPLLLPFATLILTSIISLAFGEYKALGVAYIYRLLMGGVVLISVWQSLRTTRRMLTALLTVGGVALLSAILGLLEYAPWFDIEPLLSLFKPMPTTVGGMLRLSGSFEYANGAALYLEMALPVVLALAVLVSSRHLLERADGLAIADTMRRLFRLFLFIIFGVLAMALILTMSRAALAGLLIALIVFVLAAVLRRSGASGFITPLLGRSVAIAAFTTVLAAAYIFATVPTFRLRLTSENDRDWYNVTYAQGAIPTLSAGDWVTVPLTLRNDGPMTWQSKSALPVHVSYHWLSEDKKTALIFEGARTQLPHDVNPAESVTLDASVLAPPKPGVYYLEWDLVQERVIWFSYKTGVAATPTRLVIAPASANPAHRKPPAAAMPSPVDMRVTPDVDTVERGKLWKSALKMFLAHPITGVGPDAFRNLRGKYEGISNWNRNIFTNNTYIEMFTNLGLWGGFAFLWLGGFGLWLSVRGLLREPVEARWVLGLGAAAATVAFFFHGFLDYFLFSTPLYVIFWLLFAIASLWPRMVDA